jgi:hypothetical protein
VIANLKKADSVRRRLSLCLELVAGALDKRVGFAKVMSHRSEMGEKIDALPGGDAALINLTGGSRLIPHRSLFGGSLWNEDSAEKFDGHWSF